MSHLNSDVDSDLDAAGCEDPVPLLPEHDAGPGPGLTQLGHRAVQPQRGANLDLETIRNDDNGDKERDNGIQYCILLLHYTPLLRRPVPQFCTPHPDLNKTLLCFMSSNNKINSETSQ